MIETQNTFTTPTPSSMRDVSSNNNEENNFDVSGSQTGSTKKSIKAFAVVMFLLFISLVGIAISLRQQFLDGPVAPNAPQSTPQAAVMAPTSCSMIFDVPEPGNPVTATCEGKRAHTYDPDTDGTLIPPGSNITPGQTFVYWITLLVPEDTTGDVIITDTLPSTVRYVGVHPNTNPPDAQVTVSGQTVTANMGTLAGQPLIAYRLGIIVRAAQILAEPPLINTAEVTTEGTTDRASRCTVEHVISTINPTPSPTATPSASPTATPSASPTATPSASPTATPPVFSCNSICQTSEQCRTANADYVCYQGRCRLDVYPVDTACRPPANTYVCNSSCETNAQCQTANSGYICSTQHGNVCRRADNTSAANCAAPSTATPGPTNTPTGTVYSCNVSCTSNDQCSNYNSNNVCHNGRCRLAQNPEDTSCYAQSMAQLGCNEVCQTNSDCRNSNQVCYTTGDGSKRCRLETYVTSTTCNTPSTVSTNPIYQNQAGGSVGYQDGQYVGAQPQYPDELPQSGDSTWGTLLQAGLMTLAVGVGLLLLL